MLVPFFLLLPPSRTRSLITAPLWLQEKSSDWDWSQNSNFRHTAKHRSEVTRTRMTMMVMACVCVCVCLRTRCAHAQIMRITFLRSVYPPWTATVHETAKFKTIMWWASLMERVSPKHNSPCLLGLVPSPSQRLRTPCHVLTSTACLPHWIVQHWFWPSPAEVCPVAVCNSTCFSHSQRGNSPVGFKINPQGKCKVLIRTGGEFWRQASLFHFPLRPNSRQGVFGKFDKEACKFMSVWN